MSKASENFGSMGLDVQHELRLDEFEKEVEEAMFQTMGKLTGAIKKDAKRLVRRAKLHRPNSPLEKTFKTIKSRSRKRRDGSVTGKIIVKAPGGWLELGTEHQRAFPFIEPAIEKNVPLISRELKRRMGKL